MRVRDLIELKGVIIATFDGFGEFTPRLRGWWHDENNPSSERGDMFCLEIGYGVAYSRMAAYGASLIRPSDGQPESYRACTQGRIAVLGAGVLQFVLELFPIELGRTFHVTDEDGQIQLTPSAEVVRWITIERWTE